MQFLCLGKDIAGQDVVEHNVFNKIVAVIFFIIVLLDTGQGNCKDLCIPCSHLVTALDKNGIIRLDMRAKRLIGIAIADKHIVRLAKIDRIIISGRTDLGKFAAGNNRRIFINYTDHPVDRITHLVDNTLEKTVGHIITPLPKLYFVWSCRQEKLRPPNKSYKNLF